MKRTLFVIALLAASAAAQNLTPAQKETDFRSLVATMNHWYAPLDWKKELLGVDALDLKTWMARVAETKTDLDFYEVCVDYIAALQDTHSYYALPSAFSAQLGFTVDIYDGAVLIDSINRTLLPQAAYPFAIGDEVVSVDGVSAQDLIQRFAKYSPQGNPRSTQRQAAARITVRSQSRMPHAVDVGESASVVIKRQSGNSETYTIKWTKTGAPIEVGPIPNPFASANPKRSGAAVGKLAVNGKPDYIRELEVLQHSGVDLLDVQNGVLNYGSRPPIFLGGFGTNFTRRLGGASADFFYSGVFKQDGLTIGYIRVPNYSPPSTALATSQLESELAYFQANTDGLIVDEMRNTGGSLCFGESVMQHLNPQPFWTTGFELRAFWARVLSFYNSMINAKQSGAAPEVIEQWEKLYEAMLKANRANRGVTEPIPLCGSSQLRDPAKDANGNIIAYTKPVMMIIDEFSTSTGDSVPSMFQEAGRGLLYGYRSNGAGGNNTSTSVGPYSEGTVGITIGVQVKHAPVSVPGYPATGRIENVGVHPDVVNDYMTKDNLLQNGAPFVRQFLDEMVKYIRSKQ